MALLPILAMMIAGHHLGREYWLVALAFMASWFGDSLAWMLDGSWQTVYLWLPIQFWLVALAFMRESVNRVFSLGAVVILAVTSWSMSASEPDTLLTVLGSAAVLMVAHGRIAPSLYIYFGGGTLAYIYMVAMMGTGHFEVAWWLYQGCRLMAYLLFVAMVIRAHANPRREGGTRVAAV
jgi:hypothetical protein